MDEGELMADLDPHRAKAVELAVLDLPGRLIPPGATEAEGMARICEVLEGVTRGLAGLALAMNGCTPEENPGAHEELAGVIRDAVTGWIAANIDEEGGPDGPQR